MTNLNLIKLIVGMQIQLRSIVQQASDMESALNEIMRGVEREPSIEHERTPGQVRAIAAMQAKNAKVRQKPEWRKALSERQKAYWAGPKGQARRAKGKARKPSFSLQESNSESDQ